MESVDPMACNIVGFSISPLGTHAIGSIFIFPCGCPIGRGCKSAAMLLGIGPCAIGHHVANGVASNGLAIIAVQQITPRWLVPGWYPHETSNSVWVNLL